MTGSATQVLRGWLDGMKKNGMLEECESYRESYRAAVKRIRMKLLSPTNGREGEKHDGQD